MVADETPAMHQGAIRGKPPSGSSPKSMVVSAEAFELRSGHMFS